MASNSFGKIFRITTWGESHGKAIGVIIDGCPSGLKISEEEINEQLALRAPGKSPHTSPRQEPDPAEILSGVFEGTTTGAPISIIIPNQNQDSSKYDSIKHLLRPGHANYTYLEKYGIFDHRGGGRASARETACRVAAGAIAKKFLRQFAIFPIAYIKEIGGIEATIDTIEHDMILNSPLFCPDPIATKKMIEKIEGAKNDGDSLGGIVELVVEKLPVGLGDPVYAKLEAELASAMLSIPATKGFEIGEGFKASKVSGSKNNDVFISNNKQISTETNRSGGTLGGISNGMPLVVRIAFKPTSSIMKTHATVDVEGKAATFELPPGSRHDPCVAIRGVPVVEAMAALVIADAILMNNCARVS